MDEKIFLLISAYYYYHLGVISDLKSVSLRIDFSLMNEEWLLSAFKDIFPEHSDYIDKYKISGMQNLIPRMKKIILNGIRENIYSAHDAQGMVNRSLDVLEHYEQAEAPAMNAEKIPDDLRRKPVPGPDQ